MGLRIMVGPRGPDARELASAVGQAIGVRTLPGDAAEISHVLVVRQPIEKLADHAARLWSARHEGELIVLARGGLTGVARRLGTWLSLDTTDATSPVHLLTAVAAADLAARGVDLADPVATTVGAALAGWQTYEVGAGTVNGAPPSKVGLRRVMRAWSMRNSIHAADYDMRAYTSRLPPQRRWQQRRRALTARLLPEVPGSAVLNVGAGSGRLALDLPGSVSVDLVHAKLRYMRRFGVNRFATASALALPFRDAAFDCVICCEVIEHVPLQPSPLAELVRVVAPGGRLVVSTPDYGTPVWPAIERLYALVQPHGYADEHISHYTRASLIERVEALGLRCVGVERLYGAIIIAAFDAVC